MKDVSWQTCKQCFESNGQLESPAMKVEEEEESNIARKSKKVKLEGFKIKPQNSPFCQMQYQFVIRNEKALQ